MRIAKVCLRLPKVTSSQTSTSEIPSTSIEKVQTEESETDIYPLPLNSLKSKSGVC